MLLVLFISGPSWANPDGYTLSDLEILSQEENHEEFFKHALDVRPSQRLDSWRSMVSNMADLFSQKILSKDEVTVIDFKKIETLYQWPSLKQDDVFKSRRNDIGFRYLQKCLKMSSPCWADFKAFWENDSSDPEVGYKLAEVTAGFSNPVIARWTLLEQALKSSLSEFYCQKPFVMESLWAKLEMDYIRLGTQGELTRKIDQTIHPDCLPALNKEARARVYYPGKDGDRELGYQILKAQNKAEKPLSDFFHAIYLLEKPSQGELFNYAWNGMKELGSSQERREAVLREMRKLDPLPDQLIGSLDQFKKKAILSHFKANFPEYLDFYTSQCVHFYGGKASFPKGNPTMHCQDLMRSELAPTLLDQGQIKRFQEVHKI